MKPRYSNGRFHKDLRYLYPLYWILVTTVGLQLGLGIPSGATYELFFGTHTAKAQVGEVLNDAPLADTADTTSISPTPAPVLYIPEPKPIVQEVDERSEKEQILAYIVEVFKEDAADAIVVIRKCENASFNPRATNQNRNGTVDRGIFQLNSAYWGGDELYDWKLNVEVAHKVFTRAGKKWTPWTCAHVVGQENYLSK